MTGIYIKLQNLVHNYPKSKKGVLAFYMSIDLCSSSLFPWFYITKTTQPHSRSCRIVSSQFHAMSKVTQTQSLCLYSGTCRTKVMYLGFRWVQGLSRKFI